MSSYGDDPDDSLDNPLFTHKTWVGIVVPLCVVAGIVLAAALFFYRRRRVRQRRNGVSLNRQGRLALERDILQEEGGAGQSTVDHSIYLGRYQPGRISSSGGAGTRSGRRQPRTANRWAWANTIDLASTTRTQHRMEGLNELGEAPPPYEPPPKLPKRHASTLGSSDEAVHPDDEQQEEAGEGTDGVTAPARAYLRRGSGPGTLAERTQSIDGDTIAATLTAATISTTATTARNTMTTTSTSAAASSRSRPVSSASAEDAHASASSTVATSPPIEPPAYSERTAGNGAGNDAY
ncbi:hypothetical protein SBRCBS47491_002013 [Sporothrix bragantina]|uniref:Uncharacterized protein n=1 Tax=Sporothrix bragantina TaxID=671064 RepID=A0ABP0B3C1_9PEZI